MSSIITNNSSIVALQTLKKLNAGMATVQDQVSTGLKIGSSKDNASIWAISSTMKSDITSYKAISDSVGTALSALGIGLKASESITETLKSMREKVAAASAVGADTATIQTDIDNLRETISSIVSAASFNGVNFINGTQTDGVNVLTSIDRTNGQVETAEAFVTVAGYDLTTGTAGSSTGTFEGTTLTTELGYGEAGAFGSVTVAADDADTNSVLLAVADSAAGDRFTITVGDKSASYTLTQDDVDNEATSPIADVVANKLKTAVANLGVDGFSLDYDPAVAGTIVLNNSGTDNSAQLVTFSFAAAGDGDLSGLDGLDVTTADGRTSALAAIDTALDTVITAAAALGSSQQRLTNQKEFVSDMIDGLTTGVGSLVDADMEEASARLTALQTQQQLAIQSLSIANQQPQNLLALFK